jgi:SAM-dependent methyltransferase
MNTLEADAKRKYNDGAIDDSSKITPSLFQAAGSFSALLLAEKAKLLLAHIRGKSVLDLGCANGRHLAELASEISLGIGIDFSTPFIQFAKTNYGHVPNLQFAVGDARAIPLKPEVVDIAYTFATMYHIDDIDDVVAGLFRVLRPGGIAILELGNARSLATLVSRHYPEIARHSRRTIGEHLNTLRRHGFKIVMWRSFQILPMWGDRPRWLGPLRSPRLENLLMRRYHGKMLDERISSLPGLRYFAFRHLVVCVR